MVSDPEAKLTIFHLLYSCPPLRLRPFGIVVVCNECLSIIKGVFRTPSGLKGRKR